MWQTYRLYFSHTQRVSSLGGNSASTWLVEPRPTHIAFRAQSQEQADRKAHKFIADAELHGVYSAKKER